MAAVHRDFGVQVHAHEDRLQEQASNAFISRRNGEASRGNVLQAVQRNGQDAKSGTIMGGNSSSGFALGFGSEGASMWQRSNAQYGMHAAKEQQEQQQQAQHAPLRRGQHNSAYAAQGSAEPTSDVANNPGKYNPYEHFSVKNVQPSDAHAVLATAARNDRRLGSRLW